MIISDAFSFGFKSVIGPRQPAALPLEISPVHPKRVFNIDLRAFVKMS